MARRQEEGCACECAPPDYRQLMPHPRWCLRIALLLVVILAAPLSAQEWDGPAARALAQRGTARREGSSGGPLTSWRARAHGVVLFLAQAGDLSAPPRLARADELDVEVYWRAPGASKQVIRGWRTRSWLPVDIDYHRDHLGIVTDGFGDAIRIGDGDEVRDVPHPLSAAGLSRYSFALTDSIRIRANGETLVLDRLDVRPRDPTTPALVGSIYLDRATAEVVRFSFTFTASAYLDRELEDITVALENARVDGKVWLPYRQEIEIRRRTQWLDFPARGIIRGRWAIADYAPLETTDTTAITGPLIGGLLVPGDSVRPWGAPLDSLVGSAMAPLDDATLSSVRRTVAQQIPLQALARVRSARLHAPRVSDLIHFDRVEGVAIGSGVALDAAGGRLEAVPSVGIALATGRMTGGLSLRWRAGAATVTAEASRRVRDFSDLPVISGALNSLTAEEGGNDYGDYVALDRAALGLGVPLGSRSRLVVELARESPGSLAVAARAASGTFRPNPAFGSPPWTVTRIGWIRFPAPSSSGADLSGSAGVEGGSGTGDYLRVTGQLGGTVPLGRTALAAHLFGGTGTPDLPAWRGFAIGGRGTLVGEPFRAWGGRSVALGEVEWRLPLDVPAFRLGSYASTGDRMTVAPFVASGWAGGAQAGMPWVPTSGARSVAGVAAEWLMGLLRVEGGWSLHTGSFGVTIDVSHDWWGVL